MLLVTGSLHRTLSLSVNGNPFVNVDTDPDPMCEVTLAEHFKTGHSHLVASHLPIFLYSKPSTTHARRHIPASMGLFHPHRPMA